MNGQITLVKVRAALASVTCNLPSSKTVAGFLSHMAMLGCQKCLKEFTTA